MLRLRRFALSVTMGVAASGLFGAGSADAHAVACGDTVTHSVKLTADLVNCPANGLVIGRSGITVDLNGHVIDGVPLASMDGIDNPNGFDRVVIKNGTIREFDNGIEMVSSRLNTLRDLQLLSNANRGLNLFGFDDSTIKRVSISGSSEGAGLELAGTDSSDHNRVVDSSFRLNTGVGLAINGGSDNTVIDSVAAENAGNGILIAAVAGNDAIGNAVRGVAATNNSLSGVEVTGDGAANFARSNTIRGNEANVNGGQGILLSNGARDTTVRENRARGNTDNGVLVDAGVQDSAIRANTTNGNVINGVLVTLGATDTAVRSNRADLNGNDGLKLDASGTTVRDNRAESNTNLGIEAVAGVIDGGGNHARLNGNALQCVGVLFTP
jgi:parallel beta-helix repeat protein